MTPLTHYIVVRRDLPIGVLFAMIAHAAGESFYALSQIPVSFSTVTMASGGYAPPASSGPGIPFGGTAPPVTFTVPLFNPFETIAVVLGARNEGRLEKLARALTSACVRFVEIRETEGAYAGQLLAIGVVPGDKAVIAPLVRDFHMFKELEPKS